MKLSERMMAIAEDGWDCSGNTLRKAAEAPVLDASFNDCKLRSCQDCRKEAMALLCGQIIDLEAQAEATEETHLKLPVDENGKPWHIGDECEFGNPIFFKSKISCLHYHDSKWFLQPENSSGWYHVEGCRRPAPDSWNKLLNDMQEIDTTDCVQFANRIEALQKRDDE